MIEKVQKRVFVEIFSGKVLLFLTLSLTALMFAPFSSWALFGAVTLFVAGCAAGLSQYFLNKDELIKKALKSLHQKELFSRKVRVSEVKKLVLDTKDWNDDKQLDSLESIYFDFVGDVCEQKITVPDSMLEQLDQLFMACLKSLEYSCVLWSQSTKLTTDLKKKAQDRRKKVLEDVEKNISTMFDAISQLRLRGMQDNQEELELVSRSVARSLKTAQQIDAICNGEDNEMSKYDEYILEKQK